MTNKITGLLALLMVLATTAFARPVIDDDKEKVVAALHQQFTGATDIYWEKTNSYVKASFKLNGQHLFAYFDASGALLGTSRNLTLRELPIILQTSLKKEMKTSWMTDLFEFAHKGETYYYVTLENADEKVILKCAQANIWMPVRHIKKF